MRTNFKKLPQSIINFKINNKREWNNLINHSFFESSFTGTCDNYFSESSYKEWYKFVVQDQFSFNLIKSHLKNPNVDTKLNKYKKPLDKIWFDYQVATEDVNNSELTYTTEDWFDDLINKPPVIRDLSIIVNLLSRLETCNNNVYLIERLLFREYDMYDDEHNKMLLSKKNYINNINKISTLRTMIFKYNMYQKHDLTNDELAIHEAVNSNIEFLNQFNL